jgi:hypothetical protein
VQRRTSLALVLFAAVAARGAEYRTTNFVVEAPTEEAAKQLAETAEARRKELAEQWLGKELPPFAERCRIRASVTDKPGGHTDVTYDDGKVLRREVVIDGPLDRLRDGVLPHELTHVVFAEYFRRPSPRWADEGGAVLAECEGQLLLHQKTLQKILDTPGRAIPLSRLFALKKYPPDLAVLYAEGASVSQFLVESGGRKEFLSFIDDGMGGDWDKAVQDHYGWKNVDALEGKWLAWQRDARPSDASETKSARTTP